MHEACLGLNLDTLPSFTKSLHQEHSGHVLPFSSVLIPSLCFLFLGKLHSYLLGHVVLKRQTFCWLIVKSTDDFFLASGGLGTRLMTTRLACDFYSQDILSPLDGIFSLTAT